MTRQDCVCCSGCLHNLVRDHHALPVFLYFNVFNVFLISIFNVSVFLYFNVSVFLYSNINAFSVLLFGQPDHSLPQPMAPICTMSVMGCPIVVGPEPHILSRVISTKIQKDGCRTIFVTLDLSNTASPRKSLSDTHWWNIIAIASCKGKSLRIDIDFETRCSSLWRLGEYLSYELTKLNL